jgi:hypothetical protein
MGGRNRLSPHAFADFLLALWTSLQKVPRLTSSKTKQVAFERRIGTTPQAMTWNVGDSHED